MRLILLSICALAFASAAQAAFLHPADLDKDQKISRAEWTAFKFAPDQFDKADKNHDGQVDGEEFMAWHAAGRGKNDPKPAG
jgi:hypothetical protein